MKITRVKLNGIVNPIGYDFRTLLVSWNVEDTEASTLKNGVLEVADDIAFTNIVYKKEGADLDQTGEEIQIELAPRKRYYFRVSITGDNGESAVSEIQYFETGKMDEPWIGKWIAAAEKEDFHPVFSKELNLKNQIKSARLYVSCLGVFEAYLDG